MTSRNLESIIESCNAETLALVIPLMQQVDITNTILGVFVITAILTVIGVIIYVVTHAD